MTSWNYAVNASFFGERKDRFHVYQPDRTLAQRLALISRIPGVSGVELKYPRDFTNPTEVTSLLEGYQLSLSAVNVDIKDINHFRYGALSNQDPAVRDRAVKLLQEGMDVAAAFHTDIVTTCPLAEGYDYPFQMAYDAAWKALLDSVRQVAAHRSDITFVLEYQPHEPHARILLSNVGKMLYVCQQVNAPNFGANLDIGHSFAAGESPAEAATLLAHHGWLKYIHTNDNTGEGGDWDMISGTVHFWDWLELLHTLRNLGYRGWFSGDIQPKHFPPDAAYATNIRMIQRMTAFLDRMDAQELNRLLCTEGHTPALYEYMSSFLEREP